MGVEGLLFSLGYNCSTNALALPNIGVINESLGFSGIMTVAISVALMLDLAINVSFNPTRSIIADVTPEGKIRTGGYTWMQTVSYFWSSCLFSFCDLGQLCTHQHWCSASIPVLCCPVLFYHEPRELRNQAALNVKKFC